MAKGHIPLRQVEVRVESTWTDEGVVWMVESRINLGTWAVVAQDFTAAPTSPGGDTPWIDVVVASVFENAWEAAYSRQLQLPFP